MARTRIRLTVLATAVALSTLLPASAWARPLQPIVSSNVDGRCMVAVRTEIVPQNGRAFYVAPPRGTETTMAPCPGQGALVGLRREHIWTANPDGTIVNTDGMCLDVDISRPLTEGTGSRCGRASAGPTIRAGSSSRAAPPCAAGWPPTSGGA